MRPWLKGNVPDDTSVLSMLSYPSLEFPRIDSTLASIPVNIAMEVAVSVHHLLSVTTQIAPVWCSGL